SARRPVGRDGRRRAVLRRSTRPADRGVRAGRDGVLMRPLLRWLCVAAIVVIAGCSRSSTPQAITLATTTSTQDSGLLDVLIPLFREQTGIEVKVVAVGTGQALELGRRGDADVLLVHDPATEKQFMDQGFGVHRQAVMWNDFILVGPPDDPAGVKGLASVGKAFAR